MKGSKLFIEKSSAYASGMIEWTVMRQGEKTKLRANIELSTAKGDVIKYIVGTAVAVGISGIITLTILFNIWVVIGTLAIETFLFLGIPLFQQAELDDLRKYYDDFLTDAMRKDNINNVK